MGSKYFIPFLLLSTLTITLGSCLKGDDEFPITAEDGIYIKGKATAFNHFDSHGMMKPAINEKTGLPREGLYEFFVAVSSDSEGFYISEVKRKSETLYGPVNNSVVVLNGENGQIHGTVQKGIFGPDAGVFSVPERGIYHIVIDKTTSAYLISPVSGFSLYRHINGEGLTDTDIPLVSGFDKSNMEFAISEIDMTEGEFRLRYGHGDKIEISGSEVSINTSFGGALTIALPGYEMSMVPGGSGYVIGPQQAGTYDIAITWAVGEGFLARMTEPGLKDYPEKLYLIGNGISSLEGEDAWNWDLNHFEMVPVHSRPYMFWKIVWMNVSGSFRISSEKSGESDFGKTGEAVNGIYFQGEDNIPVPGTAGYYMLVVDLLNQKISLSIPEVYLIGDAVGSWNVQNPDARLSVDNSKRIITMLKDLTSGSVRIYAWHDKGWFSNWWSAEFNIYDGAIRFRGNGPNLETVTVTPGYYTVILDFINETGSMEKCGCSPK